MLLSDNLQSSDTTILCFVAYACFHTADHCAPYLDVASVVANTIYTFFSNVLLSFSFYPTTLTKSDERHNLWIFISRIFLVVNRELF